MTRRRALVWRTPSCPCVREGPPRYDDEGSVRISHGAVDVGRGAWWSVALAVPADAAARAPAHIRMVRHGEGPSEELELLLPANELAAVVALLGGVAAQAVRDGVLPIPPA